MSVTVDEIDAARAQEYALLAALLVRAPDAALLKRLAGLRGDESPLGMAHIALAEAAANAVAAKTFSALVRQYAALSEEQEAAQLKLAGKFGKGEHSGGHAALAGAAVRQHESVWGFV